MGTPAAPTPSPYSHAELEQMLRNYRVRRSLRLLPDSVAKPDEQDLRWIRQTWRPPHLLEMSAVETSGETAAETSAREKAELAREVDRLQQLLDHGFSQLN